jgi:hypothetical protein
MQSSLPIVGQSCNLVGTNLDEGTTTPPIALGISQINTSHKILGQHAILGPKRWNLLYIRIQVIL